MTITKSFVAIFMALVALCSVISAIENKAELAMHELLNKKRGELSRERVLELLESVAPEIDAHKEERDFKSHDDLLNNFWWLIQGSKMGNTKKVLHYGTVSEENCYDIKHLDYLKLLAEQQSIETLKEFLEEAYRLQEKLCLDTFELRLRKTYDGLRQSAKDEASELAKHFSKESHQDPFEYSADEIYDGSLNVVKSYLESRGLWKNLRQARDELFQTCDEITQKFIGFLWPLMNGKRPEQELNLKEEEKRFLSVVKICAYMPFNTMDSEVKLLLKIFGEPEQIGSWASGGHKRAQQILTDIKNSFNKDIVSNSEFEQVLAKSLKQTQLVQSEKANGKKVSKKEKLMRAIKELEHHCQKMVYHFGGFLYLIDDLRVHEGFSYPKEELSGPTRDTLTLTKICKVILNSKTSDGISEDRVKRLVKLAKGPSLICKLKNKVLCVSQTKD